MEKPFPGVSVFLALTTLAVSLTVATIVNGSLWSDVRILELAKYGGVNNAQVSSGQWWRLLTAQFVHVKPAHMLFNVLTLFLLAFAVERRVGSFRLILLWGLSGIAGTYASIYSVPPPYDVGSGASQAIMGVAAAAIIILGRNPERPLWLKATLVITLVNAAALDLLSASRLQPGHVVGFLTGLACALVVVPKVDSVSGETDARATARII
jgi:membrane associated rhomboid family serine protease